MDVAGGVANQDIDLSHVRNALIDQGLELLLVRDIAGHGKRQFSPSRRLIDLRGHLFTRLYLAAGDDHLDALQGQLLCDGPSNATGRPGDNCLLTL